MSENEDVKSREEMLNFLTKKYLFYCDKEDKNLALYYWTGSKWSSNSEAIILNELTQFYETERPKITKESLLDYFKGTGQDTKIDLKPPKLIVFKNGLYNLETGTLEPHTPKYFSLNMIPHNYTPEAKCPNWIQFINDIHKAEDIAFIQEWWGYQLYTSYPVKGFTVLQGYGNNGKTVELETIEKILGHENITNTPLQYLQSDYHSSELYHKIADIADDISNKEIRLAGNIKIASDGGWLHTRAIYGLPFDFQNYAKITNSCNENPDIEDATDAVWNRLRFVEYPYVFSFNPDTAKGEKQAIDKDILENIFEHEAEGILNWMLEGLKRLTTNVWKFSYNISTEETKKLYRAKANPIICFTEEAFIFTGNEDADYVFKDDLYMAFKTFCESKKLKVIPSQTKFFRILHSDLGIDAQQPREFDRKRTYVGYKLVVLPDAVTVSQDTRDMYPITRKNNTSIVEITRLSQYVEGRELGEIGAITCDTVTPDPLEDCKITLCSSCIEEIQKVNSVIIVGEVLPEYICEKCGKLAVGVCEIKEVSKNG